MRPFHFSFYVAAAAASVLAATAFAGPPDDDPADRAEQVAERAQKAAERAADAASRAVERAERDRADQSRREVDTSARAERDAQREATASSGERTRTLAGDAESAIGVSERESEASGTESIGSSFALLQEQDSDSDLDSGSGSGDDSDLSSGSDSISDDDDSDDDNDQDKDKVAPRSDRLQYDETGNPYRADELVVLSDDAALASRAEALGFSVLETRTLTSLGAIVARVRRPDGMSSREALDLLRAREPGSPSGYNYLYRPSGQEATAPSPVTEFPAAPHGGQIIGVIDGFKGDRIGRWKVERLSAKPARVGHGDAVAAILLGDMSAVHGVQPGRLMLLDVVGGEAGGPGADVTSFVLALDHLASAKADFANISLAGPDHPALRRSFDRAVGSGLVVIAAVGNGGPAAPPTYPAAYDGVIGVAAVDKLGQPYLYSGRGPQVDVATFGVDEEVPGASARVSGTSYAAPHVTAFLAARRPKMGGRSVEALLAWVAQDAGAPGRDPVFGLGILDPRHPRHASPGATVVAASPKSVAGQSR